MRIRTLFALLAFASASFLMPATASADAQPDQIHSALPHKPVPIQACPAKASELNLPQVAQINCCSGHKGLCGCRAGKIVCCDGTVSTEPGCTCHGDEGIAE